jgi:hypothetical protein
MGLMELYTFPYDPERSKVKTCSECNSAFRQGDNCCFIFKFLKGSPEFVEYDVKVAHSGCVEGRYEPVKV